MKLQFLTDHKIQELTSGVVDKPKFFTRGKPTVRGLICEQIFGAIERFQCSCGKLKGPGAVGKTCADCSVLVSNTSRRCERYGHINLAYPIIHPFFTDTVAKSMGISKQLLNKIIDCKARFCITDEETFMDYNGSWFGIGIDHTGEEESFTSPLYLYRFLSLVDWESTKKNIAPGKRKNLLYKLHAQQLTPTLFFLNSWLIVPPAIRPVYVDEMGEVSAHTLNELYIKVLSCSNNIQSISSSVKGNVPQSLQETFSRMLQATIDALIKNGGRTRTGDELPSMLKLLKGKMGRIRRDNLGKRVDFSGRCVITSNPELPLDCVGVPDRVAYEILKPFIIDQLKLIKNVSFRDALELYNQKTEEAHQIMLNIVPHHRLMMNRQPSLHRQSLMSFKMKIHYGKSVQFPIQAMAPFNADCFTGDTLISTVDYGDIEIQQLFQMELGEFRVRSYDASGKEVVKQAHGVRPTKIVDEFIQIVLENNKVVKCSKNHYLMLSDGTYKKAKNLTEKDELMNGLYGEDRKEILVEDIKD